MIAPVFEAESSTPLMRIAEAPMLSQSRTPRSYQSTARAAMVITA